VSLTFRLLSVFSTVHNASLYLTWYIVLATLLSVKQEKTVGYEPMVPGYETESYCIVISNVQYLLIAGLWQERKKRIVDLERQISAAKKSYSETLHNLECISDDIHMQRQLERRRDRKARRLASKASNTGVDGTIVYHPLMVVMVSSTTSSEDEDSGNETSGDVDSTELTVPPLVGVVGSVKDITVRQIDCIPTNTLVTADKSLKSSPSTTVDITAATGGSNLQPRNTPVSNNGLHPPLATGDGANEGSNLQLTPQTSTAGGANLQPTNSLVPDKSLQPSSATIDAATRSYLQPTAQTSTEKSTVAAKTAGNLSTSGPVNLTSSPISPTECDDAEQMIQTNAAVMAAISRSKLQRVAASPFLLRPPGEHSGRAEDLSANGSETESVSGSFVSTGGLGALDDEQIESLMLDVSEYQRIIDSSESDHCGQMALPARLRHLQHFVNFEPIWINDDVEGNWDFPESAGRKSSAAERPVSRPVTDGDVFGDMQNVECSSNSHCSNSSCTADVMLDRKECPVTDCEAANSNMWHPLMDNLSSTTVSETD